MKYPRIGRQSYREVTVPELSGGVNTREGVTGIRDNQLSDCMNMWYKNGALKTRPGFKYFDKIISNDLAFGVTGVYNYGDLRTHRDIVNNDGGVLMSFKAVLSEEFEDDKSIIFFWWQSENSFTWLKNITTNNYNYFVVQKDNMLYCFVENGEIYKYDFSSKGSMWTLMQAEEIYVPTVMVHCQRTEAYDYKGVAFEGYNLLTPRFKLIYSAYNENDNNSSHPMRYNFGTRIASKGTVKAEIKYVASNGSVKTCVHSVDTSGLANRKWVYENVPQEDGLAMYVCKDFLGFSSENGSDDMPVKYLDNDADVKKYGPVEDNITIEANADISEEEKQKNFKKVFKMTESTWFGGTANGINGGSRLFLCGNTDDGEKGLLLWSGLNNPLYFNENNYAYVGNKAHPVTAFGKQGKNLILFKQNETYYTYYSQNDSITAESLINQSVVDYEANRVVFPIVAVHSSVGCDCPGTVQLCRNRLVWLNSEGKVYTLVSANQYSEMNIYCVSEMIEKRIKNSSYTSQKLKSAVAYDFADHYMLIIENDAFVMDYNSYGYTHIYGYLKNEDANLLIPWYFWKLFPDDAVNKNESPGYCNIGKSIAAIYLLRPSGSYYTLHCSILKGESDNVADEIAFFEKGSKQKSIMKKPIMSSVKTKYFDFSAPHYLKNIDRVSVTLGNNGGSEITVDFITNCGSSQETFVLTGRDTDSGNSAYITSKNFNTFIKAVRNFGINISCEGQLVLDGISIKYRLLGGMK